MGHLSWMIQLPGGMDREPEGHGRLKRKGERRTSSRPRKRHAAPELAPGAGTPQKEEYRAVIRALLGSFDGFTGRGEHGGAEHAYRHLLAAAGECCRCV